MADLMKISSATFVLESSLGNHFLGGWSWIAIAAIPAVLLTLGIVIVLISRSTGCSAVESADAMARVLSTLRRNSSNSVGDFGGAMDPSKLAHRQSHEGQREPERDHAWPDVTLMSQDEPESRPQAGMRRTVG